MERRLGRGLGSLLGPGGLGQGEDAAESEIELARVRPNPHQPRRHFDPEALRELQESIAQHGVIQPICVRSVGTSYEIVSGERRFRAAQLAGLSKIPATVRTEVSDDQMLELAMVENLQREDLDPIEKAEGFREMAERLGLTQEQVATRVGLKRATVTNHLRLLEHPTEIQKALREGLISMGHARALLSFPEDGERLKVLGQIVRKGLSVRQVEEWARQDKPKAKASQALDSGVVRPQRPAWIQGLEDRLRGALGTKVRVQNGTGYRGRLVIEYYDRDGLDQLIERLDPSETL